MGHRSPRRRRLTAVALAAAGLAAGTLLTACGSGGTYTITAVFSSAEGLFAGNSVEVLGVARGSVVAVRPGDGHVTVTLAVDDSQPLPAGVRAALTTPQLLGEPSVELSPGYRGGPRLPAGATIPERRTSVPVSTDQLLRDLQTFLAQVNPNAVHGTVTNLAQDLKNQGQGLNTLLDQGAATLQLLADKGDDLGRLNGTLADIAATLRQQTGTITNLLQDYDTVSGVLAANSGPLGDAITQLDQASQQLVTLLAPNLQPLQSEIGTITQVGRTLDRNLASVDQGLASSVALFSASARAYDPTYNWLNLNVQLAPGTTSAVVAGLVRDRLAGICRRIEANHSSGLSPSELQTLSECGNPDSGFFDPLLSSIPGLLDGSSTSAQAPSAQSILSQGLSEIPGLSSSQSQAITQLPASSLSGSNPAPTQTQDGNPMSGNVQLNPAPVQPAPSSGGTSSGLGGLLKGLVGTVGDGLGAVGHFIGGIL